VSWRQPLVMVAGLTFVLNSFIEVCEKKTWHPPGWNAYDAAAWSAINPLSEVIY